MLPIMHGSGMGSWEDQRWKVVITIPVEIYALNLAAGQSTCRLDPRVQSIPDPRCPCMYISRTVSFELLASGIAISLNFPQLEC